MLRYYFLGNLDFLILRQVLKNSDLSSRMLVTSPTQGSDQTQSPRNITLLIGLEFQKHLQ